MKGLLAAFGGLFLLLVVGLALFATRPWSAYDPLTMNALFDPDHRAANFRHMDAVFPARRIDASPTPHTFPRAERPLDVSYRFDGERRTLDGFLERITATGLLVLENGRIVHERYLNGADADSRLTSWSVAKSFVGTLVGMAAAEGRIDSLDDPITAYVPELAGTGYDGVPIRDVLRMASGVDFEEVYDDRLSDINRFFLKVFLFGWRADEATADYGRVRPPGEVFHYISLNTQALGMLLRAVHDGRPLPGILEEKLWHPLGAGAAFWNVDRDAAGGTALAFCCLNARLQDYARLGQLYLQEGRWRGERLLPADWVRAATEPDAPFLEPGASPYPYGPRGYGYHWWVPAGYEPGEYFASGVWGQYIYVSEPDDLVIVRTAVDPRYHRNTAESIAVFRAIRDALREPGEEPGDQD